MDEPTKRTLFPNSPNQRNRSEGSARGLKEALGGLSPHQLRKRITNQDAEITRLSDELVKAKEALRQHKGLSGQVDDLRQTITELEGENRELHGLFDNLARACSVDGGKPTGVWVIGKDAEVPKALAPHFQLIKRVQDLVNDRERLDAAVTGLVELWTNVAPAQKQRVMEILADSPKMKEINRGLGMAARHGSGGEAPDAVAKAKAEGRILPFVTSTSKDKF